MIARGSLSPFDPSDPFDHLIESIFQVFQIARYNVISFLFRAHPLREIFPKRVRLFCQEKHVCQVWQAKLGIAKQDFGSFSPSSSTVHVSSNKFEVQTQPAFLFATQLVLRGGRTSLRPPETGARSRRWRPAKWSCEQLLAGPASQWAAEKSDKINSSKICEVARKTANSEFGTV